MWTIVVMLLLVVIVPTVCLLWFVSEAVRNERMAVRQKLTDLYQSQLENLPSLIHKFWEQRIDDLSGISPDINSSERFIKIIEKGISDSVIIYSKEGNLLYPIEAEPMAPDFGDLSDEWNHAEHLELRERNYISAAVEYAVIAKRSEDINISGKAVQSQVRCYNKAGKKDEINKLILGVMNGKYDAARDKNGRLIIPDILLFSLQSINDSTDPVFQIMLEGLVSRVKDYSPPLMPSSQRLFLMNALKKIQDDIEFPTYEAESLASIYSQSQLIQPGKYGLSKISESGIWRIVSSDQTVIALFKLNRIERETQAFINKNVLNTDARFLFVLKDKEKDFKPLLSTKAGDYFLEWELIVQVKDDDLFMAASEKQISLYIWTALLIIVGILILAIITTRFFVHQMSLTRIKNDLITTVSHELKTPLASIRLLVDTLMEGRYKDENLVKDYIELIAKENDRLTRLVENFLTFSRIEDNRQTFNFKIVEPGNLVRSAYETLKHRFESGGFSFELKVQDELPNIIADYDAFVMVLLNLLDNAYHYSDIVKSVVLSAYQENGNICFEVSDKGIGISVDQRGKILKPFYQVDQTLSRKGSGFGLGLSIVKSIVDVHHGSIEIKSEPGKGSVFTIKVPVTK
ncbi:MAG: HAMP domain-containing histidine kinase [Deltaproteobacteria bacterium]|nr:HAMP domain-containing histidine kinase [Deltaproteobacteria bacterium]